MLGHYPQTDELSNDPEIMISFTWISKSEVRHCKINLFENHQWVLSIGLGQVVTYAPLCIHCSNLKIGVHTESWILGKVLHCPAIFQAWESQQNGDKVGENGKRVLSLFFSKLHSECFIIFFVFVKSYSILPICLQHIMKNSFSLHFKGVYWWTNW